MVNLHSPVLSAKDSCAYGFVTLPVPGTLNNPVLLTATLVSLWNVMSGIYLYVFTLLFLSVFQIYNFLSSWEFVTTLDYEWRVIRGRLPRRYSIWVRNNRCITGISG